MPLSLPDFFFLALVGALGGSTPFIPCVGVPGMLELLSLILVFALLAFFLLSLASFAFSISATKGNGSVPFRSCRHSKWNMPIDTYFFLTTNAAAALTPVSRTVDTSFHSLFLVHSLNPPFSFTNMYSLYKSNMTLLTFGRFRHCMLYSSQILPSFAAKSLRASRSVSGVPISQSFCRTSA